MKTIKLSLLLLCGAAFAFSQTLTLTGPASAQPGSTITLTVNLAGTSALSGASGIAGIQTSLALPAGATATPISGAASATAQKTQTCATPANSPVVCIFDAINQTTYADGTVQTYTVVMPTKPGAVTFTLTPLAASLAGEGVTLSGSNPLSITVLSPCDLNGDGSINQADLTQANSAILSGAPPTTWDLNGDGVVNIIDAQRIANAAQPGGVCKTGP